MPDITPRLGLVLPDPAENWDINVMNGNLTKLEGAAANAKECTSVTRPSSPGIGDLAYETDTDTLIVWNGAAWLAADSVGADNLIARTDALEALTGAFGSVAVGNVTLGDRLGPGVTTGNPADVQFDAMDSRLDALEGLKIVAGTIKSTGGTPNSWEVANDSSHQPIGGLAFVSVTSTQINISYNPALKIHALLATPDETLGALGWSCGASVGLSSAGIRIGVNGSLINPTQISNTSANIWIYGLFS